MKKIPSLFKRNYDSDRLVYNVVVPEAYWVMDGEGHPTEKYDGTSCMIQDGILYKRYDRKLHRWAKEQMHKNQSFVPTIQNYAAAPEGWIPAEEQPNNYTGHWPGWLKVDFNLPENKWHREGYQWKTAYGYNAAIDTRTYELVGPKIQGNPYYLTSHELWAHGSYSYYIQPGDDIPRNFDGIQQFLSVTPIEGIVWHHPDGRMVKIKRRDFGLAWPVSEEEYYNDF